MLKNTKSFYHPYFFSSRHAEHSLRLQLFWPSYYTKYILNLPKHILNILCSYSKEPFKFCQSENFGRVSFLHFTFLAGVTYIRVTLKSLIFKVDDEIQRLWQYIFLTQINKFFRDKEIPFQVIEAVHYM